jgi:16S rRNA (cytosine1402-N4)-methyltransferase
VCGKKKEIEIITKHPITASEQELAINSRSKSAKLRVAEKI